MEPERFGFLALQGLLERLDDGCLVFDNDGKCRFIGKRVGDLFGIETAVYVSRSRAHIFVMLASSCDEESALHQLQRPEFFIEKPVEVDIIRPKPRKVLVTARRIEHAGEPVGSVVVLHDVTRERAAERARLQLQSRLDEVAPIDILTGLPNWRRFHDELEREHGRAQRSKKSYAILRVDVDGMREVNESFGMPIGDRVLEELGDRLKTCRRDYDVLARYEGDEFVLLLPDASIEAAAIVADRLLQTAKGHDFRLAGNRTVTISVGGALWDPESNENWADVVRRAGSSVARAKDRGGDTAQLDAGRAVE